MGPATRVVKRWASLVRLTTVTKIHKRPSNEVGSKVYQQDEANHCVTRMFAVEASHIFSP